MLTNVPSYMNAACKKANLKSDRQLAAKWRVRQSQVSEFRRGKALPDDENMRRLAELAGEDQTIALIWLNIWRSTSAPVAELYRNLLPSPDSCELTITATRIRPRAPRVAKTGPKGEQGSLLGRFAERVEAVARVFRSSRRAGDGAAAPGSAGDLAPV